MGKLVEGRRGLGRWVWVGVLVGSLLLSYRGQISVGTVGPKLAPALVGQALLSRAWQAQAVRSAF